MALITKTKIRWFGEKPKFGRTPIIYITPLSKDVELVTVDFCERWLLEGTGGHSDDQGKSWSESLVYSSNKNPKIGFEVIMNVSAPTSFYGSPSKSNWIGVAVRTSAEDKVKKKSKWSLLKVVKS